jgi:hypothetical protein
VGKVDDVCLEDLLDVRARPRIDLRDVLTRHREKLGG